MVHKISKPYLKIQYSINNIVGDIVITRFNDVIEINFNNGTCIYYLTSCTKTSYKIQKKLKYAHKIIIYSFVNNTPKFSSSITSVENIDNYLTNLL